MNFNVVPNTGEAAVSYNITISVSSETWNTSKSKCVEQGMQLVIIRTIEKANYIEERLRTDYERYIFVINPDRKQRAILRMVEILAYTLYSFD